MAITVTMAITVITETIHSCDSFLDIQPIGKVIPNTGAGTTITIGIAATIALLGIAAVGLKKYKDIA